MLEYRFAPIEYRADADAGKVSGTVLSYGAVADIAGAFREKFEPLCFGDVSTADVLCNLQHDRGRALGRTGGGGLSLHDSQAELSAVLTLPDTSDGRDAGVLLSNRTLRGWSIEFRSERERFDDDVRVIERASLGAVSLVDAPAYGDSVAEIQKRFADKASPALKRWWR